MEIKVVNTDGLPNIFIMYCIDVVYNGVIVHCVGYTRIQCIERAIKTLQHFGVVGR